jgi:hypothetical protein
MITVESHWIIRSIQHRSDSTTKETYQIIMTTSSHRLLQHRRSRQAPGPRILHLLPAVQCSKAVHPIQSKGWGRFVDSFWWRSTWWYSALLPGLHYWHVFVSRSFLWHINVYIWHTHIHIIVCCIGVICVDCWYMLSKKEKWQKSEKSFIRHKQWIHINNTSMKNTFVLSSMLEAFASSNRSNSLVSFKSISEVPTNKSSEHASLIGTPPPCITFHCSKQQSSWPTLKNLESSLANTQLLTPPPPCPLYSEQAGDSVAQGYRHNRIREKVSVFIYIYIIVILVAIT